MVKALPKATPAGHPQRLDEILRALHQWRLVQDSKSPAVRGCRSRNVSVRCMARIIEQGAGSGIAGGSPYRQYRELQATIFYM